MLANLESYSLCNATNFEYMDLVPSLFEIEPLDDHKPRENIDK